MSASVNTPVVASREKLESWLHGRVWRLGVAGHQFTAWAYFRPAPKRPYIRIVIEHNHEAIPWVPPRVKAHFAAEIDQVMPGFRYLTRTWRDDGGGYVFDRILTNPRWPSNKRSAAWARDVAKEVQWVAAQKPDIRRH